MKEYWDSIGVEVTVSLVGIVATFLGWLIGKLSSYKRRIVEETISDLEIDTLQDKNIIRMDAKVATLERIIDRLQTELNQLKGDNAALEQKLFRNLERVETKIDKVYAELLKR